jgi:addiction module RelE/StbE family toxin
LEANELYKLTFLPIAERDMVEIVRYISHDLANPTAAEHLAVSFIEEAEKLLAFPYAPPLYHPIRPLAHEYRKLMVQNYMMLYWVDEQTKTVTIARVVYAKRDYGKLLD